MKYVLTMFVFLMAPFAFLYVAFNIAKCSIEDKLERILDQGKKE